jgi:alpha-L-fucosidase
LFNVGPDKKGNIPEAGVKFLRETGSWIKTYPQVIYGAGYSPWGHALPWGDVTTRDHSLFLSIFEWPQDGKLYLPGLSTEIISAEILGVGPSKHISFHQGEDWTVFNLPCEPADVPASVIEVKLGSQAEVVKVDPSHGIYPNITSELPVEFAKVSGAEKSKIRWMEKFGEWKQVNQVSNWGENSRAQWTVDVLEPGYYYLELRYKGRGRLVWKTQTTEGIIVQNQQAASHMYQYYPMGILEFKSAGEHRLSVSLVRGDPKTSSLAAIRICPIQGNL